jgi:hypothetical protein
LKKTGKDIGDSDFLCGWAAAKEIKQNTVLHETGIDPGKSDWMEWFKG